MSKWQVAPSRGGSSQPLLTDREAGRGGLGILGEDGATLVEMAICSSTLLCMIFGVIYFSMALYTYNYVDEASTGGDAVGDGPRLPILLEYAEPFRLQCHGGADYGLRNWVGGHRFESHNRNRNMVRAEHDHAGYLGSLRRGNTQYPRQRGPGAGAIQLSAKRPILEQFHSHGRQHFHGGDLAVDGFLQNPSDWPRRRRGTCLCDSTYRRDNSSDPQIGR